MRNINLGGICFLTSPRIEILFIPPYAILTLMGEVVVSMTCEIRHIAVLAIINYFIM